MKVKICGISDVKAAIAAVESGADAIGFVFAESKRKVTAEMAKEIVGYLPEEVLKVGVFVNESKKEIEKIASLVGLTHIQLHGDESAEFSKSLSLPVIKAVSIDDQESLNEVDQFPCEYLLLDGPKGKYRGGNGEAFDWHSINTIYFEDKKVIVAGGLHENNVEEAIKAINPYMIDVSSGVETAGVKDLGKIHSFIHKAKRGTTK